MQSIGKQSKPLLLAQEKIDKVLLTPKVVEKVEDIRKRWGINPSNPDEYLEKYECTFVERAEQLGNDDAFNNDVKAILRIPELRLHSEWLETLIDHIIWDDVDLKLNSFLDPNATIYKTSLTDDTCDPYNHEPRIIAHLNPRTTLSDWKKIWTKGQKNFKDHKVKKDKPWNDYPLAKDIYFFAKRDYPYSEIKEILKRKHNKTIYPDKMKKLLSQYHKNFEVPKELRAKLKTTS